MYMVEETNVYEHMIDMITNNWGWGRLTLLLAAGALVLGGDVHDAVSVNVKCDLHLGDATRRGWDAY